MPSGLQGGLGGQDDGGPGGGAASGKTDGAVVILREVPHGIRRDMVDAFPGGDGPGDGQAGSAKSLRQLYFFCPRYEKEIRGQAVQSVAVFGGQVQVEDIVQARLEALLRVNAAVPAENGTVLVVFLGKDIVHLAARFGSGQVEDPLRDGLEGRGNVVRAFLHGQGDGGGIGGAAGIGGLAAVLAAVHGRGGVADGVGAPGGTQNIQPAALVLGLPLVGGVTGGLGGEDGGVRGGDGGALGLLGKGGLLPGGQGRGGEQTGQQSQAQGQRTDASFHGKSPPLPPVYKISQAKTRQDNKRPRDREIPGARGDRCFAERQLTLRSW